MSDGVLFTEEQLMMFANNLTPSVYSVFKEIWQARRNGGLRKVDLQNEDRGVKAVNHAITHLMATTCIEYRDDGRTRYYIPTTRGAQLAKLIADNRLFRSRAQGVRNSDE